MNKFIAIIVAVFALNVVAADVPAPVRRPEVKIKRITLKRIVKYQIHHAATDDDIVLVDTVPTLGRNRYYYTWNKLIQHNDEVSDEIRLRLAIARIKAMSVYKQTWA